jgi:hypothetical protein
MPAKKGAAGDVPEQPRGDEGEPGEAPEQASGSDSADIPASPDPGEMPYRDREALRQRLREKYH